MPFCPKCKYEYVEYVSRCPDCDVQLVPELPPEPETSPDEFEIVYIAKNAMEANIIKGGLNGIGMPVIALVLHDESSGFRFLMASPRLVGDTLKIGIHVPRSRADEARQYIEETYHGEVCPNEIHSMDDNLHADSPGADLTYQFPDTEEQEFEVSEEDAPSAEAPQEEDDGWLRPRGAGDR